MRASALRGLLLMLCLSVLTIWTACSDGGTGPDDDDDGDGGATAGIFGYVSYELPFAGQ